MYINAHISYVDSELGILVKDFNLIFKRYYNGFMILDLLSILPIDLFVRIFTQDMAILKFFFFNRLLRFLYLQYYYKECTLKLSVSSSMKWFHLIYGLACFIQVMTCMW